jgi:hypothetical protein
LVHDSRPEEIPDPKSTLEGQLRESYGRVVYTHKVHEKCAEILLERLSRLKVLQIVLAALTTTGFIATLFFSVAIVAALGAAVSTILLSINAYTKDYDLGAEAEDHRRAASDIWMIRERYLSLLTDLAMNAKSLDEARLDRDALAAELNVLYAGSPGTTSKAYKRAQASLKSSGDMTFSDAEIDAFLPGELKRTQRR